VNDRTIKDGNRFEAEFVVFGDDSDTHNDLDRDPNPYIDDDEEVSVTSSFTVKDVSADFDNVRRIAGTDTLEVLAEEDYEVTGTSNLAPGTEITVRARDSDEPAFLKTDTVEIEEGGTWTATFDFSDLELDREFTWTIRKGGSTLEEIDGGVVTQIATPTQTPRVVTRTVQQPSPTPREVEVTRTVIQPSPTPREVTRVVEVTPTDGQPGFGIAVAIVALLAAALLALRRRD
jgi:PGF-CTERM protein